MTFEDWWEENKRRTPEYWSAREAWDAATKAERERCREIAVKHGASACKKENLNVGWSIALNIADEIGDD